VEGSYQASATPLGHIGQIMLQYSQIRQYSLFKGGSFSRQAKAGRLTLNVLGGLKWKQDPTIVTGHNFENKQR
jgi:hypothetical protein